MLDPSKLGKRMDDDVDESLRGYLALKKEPMVDACGAASFNPIPCTIFWIVFCFTEAVLISLFWDRGLQNQKRGENGVNKKGNIHVDDDVRRRWM